MPGNGLVGPPTFAPNAPPEAIFMVWLVLALAAFVYAVGRASRDHDVLPIAACFGALICALNEPIFDVLGKLTYADVPAAYVAFTAFERHIPWSLVIGYLPWVGLMPYLIYRFMANGATRQQLYRIAAGLSLSVILVEILNVVWLGNWMYYAEDPVRGILAGGVVQMASMPLLCALLYLILDRPSGPLRRIALGIIVPCISLPMLFAATSWPIYISNYGDLPVWADWVAAGVAVALCVGAVVVITGIAEQWQTSRRPVARA